ncbi:hypothetical protein K438DRAFT_1966269 [Mycena galopus ATCC 62051]|nr:hypothetical protein K438DRAFT_1966269 [Mycena galopus ATCC 62051]
MSAPPDTVPEEHATPDAEAAKPEPDISIAGDAAADTTVTPATEAPAPADTPAAPAALASTPAQTTEPVAPPRERELVADPRLGVLRAMFPDFDDSLLQSVLNSVQGDTDRAIDALLGMSDPNYHSEPVPQQAQPQTQEELDEQLARTLMLEDERSHHAWRAQEQQQQQQQQPRPDVRRQGSSGGPERDTMQEFQEQFNKFAETGKKTLGSLFSKVKAKIQEFDQPAGQSSGSGVGGDTYPYDANQNPYPNRHQISAQHQQQAQAQAQAQMPAYYDPNAGDANTYSPPGSASPTVGYDVGAPASMGTPNPPSTNSGAPQIDAGKLGMLPKRPVSLLRTNSPPSATSGAPPSSDDDELEYAENPFEEGKK